jgi:predicted N-acetyltransferase YhbS
MFDSEEATQPLAVIPDETSDRICSQYMQLGKERARHREARRAGLLYQLNNKIVRVP